MKKIHVSAINRKVRDDEKLFVEECDRKYNEKLVAIADSIEEHQKEKPTKSRYFFLQVRQGRARPQQR